MFASGRYEGVVVLQKLHMQDSKHVYLIGERHNATHAHAVIDEIARYATTHPSEKIVIAYESSQLEIGVDQATSPTAMVNAYVRNGTLPTNVAIELVNSRRDYPYDLFECLYDIDTFAALRYMAYRRKCVQERRLPVDYMAYRAQSLQLAKRFEKTALQHISTRRAFHGFLMSLLLPDRPFPAWYLRCYHDATDQGSLVKLYMSDVKDTDPVYYVGIRQYLEEKLEYILSSNTAYSGVMDMVRQRRRTASERMEIMKDPELEHFFVVLYSFLEDVHVLAHSRLADCAHYVVITGAAHTMNMSRFFTSRARSSAHWVSHQGSVDIGASGKEGPIADPRLATVPMEEHLARVLQRRPKGFV